MSKKIVVIERTYEAPIEKVWEALTDKDQMKQWYFAVTDFKAEVGFEFQFSVENDGKIYLHKCKVVEANPITKVAYTWSYDGYVGQSLVTFELFNEDKDKTRLKLTHSDLDTNPVEVNPFRFGHILKRQSRIFTREFQRGLGKHTWPISPQLCGSRQFYQIHPHQGKLKRHLEYCS
jgi:uncharacterized protein YndB with AHSA1/START domain